MDGNTLEGKILVNQDQFAKFANVSTTNVSHYTVICYVTCFITFH